MVRRRCTMSEIASGGVRRVSTHEVLNQRSLAGTSRLTIALTPGGDWETVEKVVYNGSICGRV